MIAGSPWVQAMDRLREGRPHVFRARGNSMRPTIPDNALVTLLPIDRPRVGDILLAIRGEQVQLHRAVGRMRGTWILKGDRNASLSRFRQEELVARVSRVEHGGRVWDHTTPIARLRGFSCAAIAWAAPAWQKLRSLF